MHDTSCCFKNVTSATESMLNICMCPYFSHIFYVLCHTRSGNRLDDAVKPTNNYYIIQNVTTGTGMGDLNVYVSIFPHTLDKTVGTVLGWGWGKKFCAANIFVCVTLTYTNMYKFCT